MNSEKFDCWRPNGKKKPQMQKSETQHWPKTFETPRCKNQLKTRLLRPIKNASKILTLDQNFLRPTFFKVPFYTPQMQSAAYIRHSLSVYLHHQMTDIEGIFVMFVSSPSLENCRVVTFVHHIISQSFFFTLKRNKRYCIHHLTLIWVWVNLYCINFIYFTHYTGPQLKVVSTMSVGFDHVSLPEAVKR